MHRLLDDFKVFANLDSTVTDRDDAISTLLSASEQLLKDNFGIYIAQDTITETLDGNGKKYLYLSYKPVTVTSVTIDGDVVDSSTYYVKDNKIRFDSTITSGYENVEVVYTVGYADADIPYNLKTALYKLANKFYKDTEEAREGINSFNTDTKMGISYKHQVYPDNFEELIAPYRIIKL